LEWLLAGSAGAAEAKSELVNPLAPKRPHFPARAKSVIYMHMVGAPSQIDLFEHKPKKGIRYGRIRMNWLQHRREAGSRTISTPPSCTSLASITPNSRSASRGAIIA
jgi:hypothetical protein